MPRLSDVLRKAVKKHDETIYRLAIETGIAHSQLYRFLEGTGLNTENLEDLAEYLGYGLTKKKGN